MRTQLKNSISALVNQMVSVVIGLILPRIMLQTFGSSVYGLGTSIAQFLSYVTLLEAGIGGVAKSALYKAFADKNNEKVSGIIKAIDQFFKKLSIIFIIYVAILAFIYPRYINSTFDSLFTGSLICIIAISSLMQYCFGITYSIFLQADQKNYVANTVNIITIILNALVIFGLIEIGASFHAVKLASAAVFVLRPIVYNRYVHKNYCLNYQIGADTAALNQKWSGFTHHIAWFLHTNTDVAVITLFGKISQVSVYSVYYMIASNMTKIVSALVNGVEAMFGNMLATNGEKHTSFKFTYYSMIMNSVVIVLFTTASSMLMSFIVLYTSEISDENYYLPQLGYLLLLAEGAYCLRVPYHSIVTAAGHFRQTQLSAIIETSLNIILSIFLFRIWGLPGVAAATAISIIYRTIYYIWYLSQNILKINFAKNMLRIFVAIMVVVLFAAIHNTIIPLEVENYFQWIFQAIVVFILSCLVVAVYDFCLYRREFKKILGVIAKRFAYFKF